MEEILQKLEQVIFGLPLMLILLFTHIYFSIKLKFPFRKIFSVLRKEISYNDRKGEITPIKSLMTVLAGTLGTGNIIGIASAVIIGGAGSIFWIFVSGILAIATKYAETYIVLKYRKRKNNKYIGGAMYILDEVLYKKKLAKIFAIFLIFSCLTMGAMMQSNSVYSTCKSVILLDSKIVATSVTLLAGYIIFGNEKRIAKASSILVPLATIMYLVCSILLIMHYNVDVIMAINVIIKSAFDFKSALGGIVGSSMIIALREGLSKGLFTNEAGMGTSPIFDINVETESIVKQSIISSSSVFIDTVVLCTITGIIYVASGLYENIQDAAELSNMVFGQLKYGEYFLSFFLSIFAFSTIPCSCYYGWSAVNYIFNNKKIYEVIYKLVFLVFVFIGANMNIQIVLSLATIANIFLMLPNIYMIFKLRKDITLED
ncbi:MAG: sodium:alanine symporter family protein [Clostridia bacterium]|nr:sodium:alanine symporter family protein [Clostridia bacterium]